MSQAPSTSTSSSDFQFIFNAALKAYEKKTKKDLLAHPLAAQLQACNSPADILVVLQDKVRELDQSRSADERLSRWLNPTIDVLYAFSATLGEGVGLVFSPARVIFAGAGVLLLAAKDVDAGQDTLIDLFERIEHFFKRLESYTSVRPTDVMTNVIIKIMIEVLNIFAIATKEMKQGRAKKYLMKLVGRNEMEDALKRLDKLTQEEARMAAAETLRLTHIITNDVEQLASSVDDMKWNESRKSLREWVFPPDPSTNHNIACDLYHGGTAQWFFQGSMFGKWKSTGSLLWIYGKRMHSYFYTKLPLIVVHISAGSGKTVLCSAIVQDIVTLSEAGSASMAYFYFDFRDLDKQHIRNLLPSLLIQLSAQSDRRRDILSQLYLAHDNGEKKPRVGVMTQCLRDMLTIPDQRPIYIILDALDECPNSSGIPSPREQVVGLVKDLANLRPPHLHICVTSRPEFDIRATLEPLALQSVSLHDQSGQKKDIVDYIHFVVYSDSETMMKKWREGDKKMVVEALSEKADGMFRWVFCQLETLRQCLPQSVRRTLNELPESLDGTYERVMMGIKKANQVHAYRMLQCLTVAARPLSVAELAELLAFNFDVEKDGIPELNSDWRWEDHEQAVLSTCSSLIAVVPGQGSPVVQFSHFSVKEFLMSDRLAMSTGDISQYHISLEDAHTVLARACLGVLLRDPDVTNGADRAAPLVQYAAEHWVTHARVENVASRVRNGMGQLFDLDQPYFEAWVKLHDFDDDDDDYSPDPDIVDLKPGARPLYYAALCGLLRKYSRWLSWDRVTLCVICGSSPGCVDVRDRVNDTALQWASQRGHCDVVKCLLNHGADVNLRDDFQNTPLALAARCWHMDVVRVLLEHGADVHSRDKQGQTPLHDVVWGARAGHTLGHTKGDAQGDAPQIVRLLLEHGADIDAKDKYGKTPLQVALERGKSEIVWLLSEFRSGRAQI
ncbi:hypothetical protein EDB85DRAFT_2212481 [Lactarius pseudohatsudake]|nr:hypothetical protein EDB85DRAFT_2212481 [Lactarius pseudohatsudake]